MLGFVLLLVFFGTALLVLGTYGLVNRRRLAAAEALRKRLGDAAPVAAAEQNILRETHRSSVAALDRLLASMQVSDALEYELRRAGAPWSVGEFLIGSAVISSILMLLGLQLAIMTAWIGAIIGLAAPFLLLRQMQNRRKKKFEEQLPDAIDMIVNAMRAGFSFQAALKFVGEEIPAPLGEEFTRVYDEQRLGSDVRSALLAMQERVGTLDVRMLVTSLLIQRETGGNLSEVLSGLATLVRDRAALRGHVETLTAEPKYAGRVLAMLPVVAFLAILYGDRPLMIPMFTTTTGRLILLYAVLSIIVGYMVLMKIADIEL